MIAEAGVNHNGDIGLAHALIDLAADCGADAIKFQTFVPRLVVSAAAPTAQYQQQTTGADHQLEMLEALTLPDFAYPELKAHAAERSVVFLSTAFDIPSADLLEQLGVEAFKIPSGELTNTPFLRNLASRGRPLLLSTGMADEDEIADALTAVAAAPGVVLLHCVSAYPAPTAEANLRVIPALTDRFGVPVGWSDHTETTTCALGAVALGAVCVERHVTTDRSLPGPDHAASSDPVGFATYVAQLREMQAALGDGHKRPMPSEIDVRAVARRAWHASRSLAGGDVIRDDDVIALRPAAGVPPSVDVVGRRLTRGLEPGDPVTVDDLE